MVINDYFISMLDNTKKERKRNNNIDNQYSEQYVLCVNL